MTPQLVSIEIGNVDASTIVAVFSEAIQANHFEDGWTFTKNGAALPILSVQQVNPNTLYFGVGACLSTDTIQAVYSVAPVFSDPSRTAYISNWTPPDWRG
jgi:hypothetical protein